MTGLRDIAHLYNISARIVCIIRVGCLPCPLINKFSCWLLQTALFGLLGGFAQPAYSAEDLRLLMVLSDNSSLYQSFAKTFGQNLPPNIHLKTLDRAEDFDRQTADLIVTVGVKAADRVAGKTTLPMLAAMIPSSTYADLQGLRHAQISAIYLDQPLSRQVDLLRAAIPDRSRVGVLYSAATRLDVPILRAELNRQHATLTDRVLHESLFADLEAVLDDSDVLLALPDATIYNANTIRNILLSSYRRGIPLIGFSQAYVKAGALCAIFSTPEQLAAQAGATTVSFAKTGKLPDGRYPVLYSIAVNQEVARTLGITIKSAEALRLQIEQLSNGRGKDADRNNEIASRRDVAQKDTQISHARFPHPNPLPEGEGSNDSLREFNVKGSR